MSLEHSPQLISASALTGAAGQIAYSLLPLICSGQTFGPNTRIRLRLLEVPSRVDHTRLVSTQPALVE